MSNDAPQLSSIQHTIEDLSVRIEAIAARHDTDPEDPVAAALYDVERSLRHAARMLERVRGRLDS